MELIVFFRVRAHDSHTAVAKLLYRGEITTFVLQQQYGGSTAVQQ